jgi:hypothetical protein
MKTKLSNKKYKKEVSNHVVINRQFTRIDFKSSPKLCDAELGSKNSLTDGTNIWLPKTCGFIGGGNMANALL